MSRECPMWRDVFFLEVNIRMKTIQIESATAQTRMLVFFPYLFSLSYFLLFFQPPPSNHHGFMDVPCVLKNRDFFCETDKWLEGECKQQRIIYGSSHLDQSDIRRKEIKRIFSMQFHLFAYFSVRNTLDNWNHQTLSSKYNCKATRAGGMLVIIFPY